MRKSKQSTLLDELDDYKVVLVKWTDARTTAQGWTNFTDVDESLPVCYTAGILLDETDTAYVIAESWAEDEDVLNVMDIPKCIVLGIQELK